MRTEGVRGGHEKGHGHRGRKRDGYKHGAKTFRRGRAIAFLEQLELKRSTLKKQLETPELQTINPIIVGELKAIETVISEFVELFELYEMDVDSSKETEISIDEKE